MADEKSSTKICTVCKTELHKSNFSLDIRRKDGHRSYCKACGNEAAAKWREANRNRIVERDRLYREENRARLLKYQREYNEANRDKKKTLNRKWRIENPIKARRGRANRRARERNASGKLSDGIYRKLVILQRGKCACCGEKLGDNYHLDHIMPLALGGTNTDTNVQLLRAECNLRKGSKHPIEFMQQRGWLL